MGQVEGAFSQPNAGVCERMIEWAHAATAGSHDGDLLELYCGADQAAAISVCVTAGNMLSSGIAAVLYARASVSCVSEPGHQRCCTYLNPEDELVESGMDGARRFAMRTRCAGRSPCGRDKVCWQGTPHHAGSRAA
jgi:hypothetical protein